MFLPGLAVGEPAGLSFRTIELPRHEDVCVRFRRDSYNCSFGDSGQFDRENGPEGRVYLDWLAARIAEFPQGFIHMWRNGEIVGQLEMRPRGDPPIGYVNLFYLIPAVRGSGLSGTLHEYALSISGGLQKLQLRVSPSNLRAPGFYRKHAWKDLGPRPGYAGVHLMELEL